jgi:Domain of unknown function (DUF4331)
MTRHQRKPLRLIGLLAATAVTITAGTAGVGFAADHLDAPGLTSPQARPDADINDVYVFNSDKAGSSVIAVTTGPGAGAIAPLTYATDVSYKINVDQNGDAVEDLAYVVEFKSSKGSKGKGNDKDKGKAPKQSFTVTQYVGENAQTMEDGRVVAKGNSNQPEARIKGGGKAWTGLRSDPFFFDLDAFRQVVLQQDRGRTGFCDKGGQGVDFFAALNTNAIILDLPNATLGGKIGVWAQTIGEDDTQIDQMGRPAINAVFNSGDDKNIFNQTPPSKQAAKFAPNVTKVLSTFSALDSEGVYSADVLKALSGVLIPDMVTFDTATPAAGPLNGRALSDDVIDAELNIVTGGFQVPGRDAKGAIGTDCVAAHTDTTASFPYLGKAH